MSKDEKELYCSCHDLENGMILFSDGVKHCCGLNELGEDQTLIEYENSLEKTVEKLIEEKKKIIRDNCLGKKTMCTGCSRLVKGNWDKEKKIRQLNFSLDYICNLKCQYCEKWSKKYTALEKKNIDKMMDELNGSSNVDIRFPILFSSGEISILPNRADILKALSSYNVCFFSNATKYQDDINEKITKTNSCIVVSLDCGTRETYKRIKGVDLFETVCHNIKLYSANSEHVILKYIVTEENLNQEDIEGFLNICSQCNIHRIIISRDFYKPDSSEDIKSAVIRIVYQALKMNLKVYTDGVYEACNNMFRIEN